MIDRAPWSKLLTIERVDELHAEVLSKYGGLGNPAVDGCVERSLAAAWTAEGYVTQDDETAQPGLVFAGHVLFYIAKNHCWADGNGRTALAAMHEVIAGLGLTLDVTENELYEHVMAIKKGSVKTAGDAVKWIASRLVELT